MKVRRWVVGAAVAALACSAASAEVIPESKVDALAEGQSEAEVLRLLGPALAAPQWPDATHSLIYKTDDGWSPNATLYVDIDNATGKVTSIVVFPQEHNGGDVR